MLHVESQSIVRSYQLPSKDFCSQTHSVQMLLDICTQLDGVHTWFGDMWIMWRRHVQQQQKEWKTKPSVMSVGESWGKQTVHRERKMEVMRIRTQRRLSHEKAARNEKNQQVRENKSGRKHDEDCFWKEKMKFWAFVAVLINWAAEAEIWENRESCWCSHNVFGSGGNETGKFYLYRMI